MMDKVNSPCSFSEDEEYFGNVPSEWLHPTRHLQEIKTSMEKDFKDLRISLETATSEVNNPKKNIEISNEVERLRQKESQLLSAISVAKQSLREVSLKKQSLAECGRSGVSEEELTVLLRDVVSAEKENELKVEEMKLFKRKLVGKMCFYKEYLNVYIDILGKNDYKFYFRKCRGQGDWRPKEWVRIQTDNFRDYNLIEISLPEGSNEWLDFMEMYEKGVHLRTLIHKARQLLCSK